MPERVVLERGRRDVRMLRREASQHGVYEPRGALRAGGANAAHRLVDRRGVGDPLAADDLIGAEP